VRPADCLLATNVSKPPPTLPVAKATKGKGAAKKNAIPGRPTPAAPPSPVPPVPSTLPVPTPKGRSLKNTRRDEDDDDNEDDDDDENDDDDDIDSIRRLGVGISQPRGDAISVWAYAPPTHGYQMRDDDLNSDDDEDEEDDDEDAVFKGRLYILTARSPLTRNPDIGTYSYIDPDGHTVLMPAPCMVCLFFLYST